MTMLRSAALAVAEGRAIALAVGVVLCILAVIVAVARRDAPAAGAGILSAVILGVLAILSHEHDRRDC
jgi:hypothetical protein